MDSGWLVAGTSIATIVATGFFNIWSKHIDKAQKIDEHKLTIRSLYVAKKIEAGQEFISRNTVLITKIHVELALYQDLLTAGRYGKDLTDRLDAAYKAVVAMSLERNNFSDLYFDLSTIETEYNKLSYSYNLLIIKMNAASDVDKPVEVETVNDAISHLNQMLALNAEMANAVRTRLAKYDIL
ncbi:hypothetical protein Q5H92_24695 [Hymenobacter sp. M29]|uniref:Uncharacterized protein n=1 Tax=Hymenobacter mellowenesis TaxID=3063995 RepID=A0ABT9AI81_9BACT|nr:hypothetical protein [Hymenobacter sp. M29]MDO7849584.1 hypothetical protein [Hymenobacter sp. M29]